MVGVFTNQSNKKKLPVVASPDQPQKTRILLVPLRLNTNNG
jgi:hypothetical protein